MDSSKARTEATIFIDTPLLMLNRTVAVRLRVAVMQLSGFARRAFKHSGSQANHKAGVHSVKMELCTLSQWAAGVIGLSQLLLARQLQGETGCAEKINLCACKTQNGEILCFTIEQLELCSQRGHCCRC